MTQSMQSKTDLLAIEKRGGNPLRLTYRELYEFVRAGDPVVTVQDAVAEFTVSHQTIRERLEELHEAGYIERRKLHRTTSIWYVSPPEQEDV